MFTILYMSKMGLPEDLNITGLKAQDQEILLSNHRPAPPVFYTLLHSNT